MNIWIGSFSLAAAFLVQIVILGINKDLEHGRKLALHACCGLYLIAAAICFK